MNETMTSPQRVFAAMQRRTSDRTPTLENTIDPAVVAALGFGSYAQMYMVADYNKERACQLAVKPDNFLAMVEAAAAYAAQ